MGTCDEERRHERCKASNNDEGGREETSRKSQTEVDGQSAGRSETTPARPRARTEPISMEKGNHGDRPRTGIRSAKVSNGEQLSRHFSKYHVILTLPNYPLSRKRMFLVLVQFACIMM